MKKYIFKPWAQWLAIFGLTLIAFFLSVLFTDKTDVHWTIICGGVLFFALANPILSVFTSGHLKYSLISIPLLLSGIVLFLFMGKFGVTDSWKVYPSFQQILGLAVLIHFMALGLARALKGIYTFTMQEGQEDYFK